MGRAVTRLAPRDHAELFACQPALDLVVVDLLNAAKDLVLFALDAAQAIFDAIWKSGEMPTFDATTHRVKSPLPSIDSIGTR